MPSVRNNSRQGTVCSVIDAPETSPRVTAAPPPTEDQDTISPLLKTLPDWSVGSGSLPRRGRQHLDLLLLVIEAMDLGGSEAILWVAQELGLQDILRHRVQLWQIRNTNPLRRYNQRRSLSLAEAKALVLIICNLAQRLSVAIRQNLLAVQQQTERGQSLEDHLALGFYLERFRSHFRSRMNPRRAAVAVYQHPDELNRLAIGLLQQLLLCSGTAGPQRLWTSLFDGEV